MDVVPVAVSFSYRGQLGSSLNRDPRYTVKADCMVLANFNTSLVVLHSELISCTFSVNFQSFDHGGP